MIKQFFKKVLISYLIIICCIYTPTAQAAGWNFGGFNFGNGSLNIVKDGVKITTAAVDSAPITSSLAKKILSGALRGAGFLSALSLAVGIAEDALDWVLDPANNQIRYKYTDTSAQSWYRDPDLGYFSTQDALCRAVAAKNGQTFVSVGMKNGYYACFTKRADGTDDWWAVERKGESTVKEKTIPIPTVAQKIYDMAKSGNTNAQADVTSAVTELVNAGTYDTPINQAIQQAIDNGTIPKDTDTNTNNPTNPQIDTSSITAAIQSLASSFASAISNAFNGITSVINTSIDKILNKQDQIQGELVNTGSKIDAVGGQVVGVGDKVDNVGGKVVGVGDAVKDVGGKVVGLNDSVDKVGDKVVGVGDKVDAAGEKVGTRVDAVGDKVTGVGTRVDAVGDKVVGVGDKVDAAGDKVTDAVTGVGDKVTGVGTRVDAVGDKVDAASDKVADAVKESTKEITKKMDETKPQPFELPAFCSWASKVCDFIDWVKKDPELPQDDNTPIVKDEKDSSFVDEYANKSYVNFSGQCPAPPVFNIFGGQITFPMEIVCKACEQMSWVFISFAWLRAVMIVFFASKG